MSAATQAQSASKEIADMSTARTQRTHKAELTRYLADLRAARRIAFEDCEWERVDRLDLRIAAVQEQIAARYARSAA